MAAAVSAERDAGSRRLQEAVASVMRQLDREREEAVEAVRRAGSDAIAAEREAAHERERALLRGADHKAAAAVAAVLSERARTAEAELAAAVEETRSDAQRRLEEALAAADERSRSLAEERERSKQLDELVQQTRAKHDAERQWHREEMGAAVAGKALLVTENERLVAENARLVAENARLVATHGKERSDAASTETLMGNERSRIRSELGAEMALLARRAEDAESKLAAARSELSAVQAKSEQGLEPGASGCGQCARLQSQLDEARAQFSVISTAYREGCITMLVCYRKLVHVIRAHIHIISTLGFHYQYPYSAYRYPYGRRYGDRRRIRNAYRPGCIPVLVCRRTPPVWLTGRLGSPLPHAGTLVRRGCSRS